MKLGIAFAGGGARGAAHLGVLQALEEVGITADFYTGTSAGSIIAAMKALGYDNSTCLRMIEEANDNLIDIDYVGIAKGLFTKFDRLDGLVKGEKLKKYLIDHLGKTFLMSVKHPISIVSTDINTGAQVVFSSVDFTKRELRKIDDNIKAYDRFTPLSLPHIVYTSCSIPGIFQPLTYNKMKLVDGSITNNLPCNLLQLMGADKVIAVDLSHRTPMVGYTGGIFNVIGQSANILIDQTEYLSLSETPDVVVMNPDVTHIGLLDFNRTKEAYDVGYEYGKKYAADIKKQLESR